MKINYLQGFIVPGAGIEPARIAPLVFETSASTDSAIRAGVLFCSLSPGLKEAHEGYTFCLRIAKVFEFSENAKLLESLYVYLYLIISQLWSR